MMERVEANTQTLPDRTLERDEKFNIKEVVQQHQELKVFPVSEEGKHAAKIKGPYGRTREILDHVCGTMAGERFSDSQREIVFQLCKTIAIQEQLAVSKLPAKADDLLEIHMGILHHMIVMDDAPAFVEWLESVIQSRSDVVKEVCKDKIVHLKLYAEIAWHIHRKIEKQLSESPSGWSRFKNMFMGMLKRA